MSQVTIFRQVTVIQVYADVVIPSLPKRTILSTLSPRMLSDVAEQAKNTSYSGDRGVLAHCQTQTT